MAKNPLSPRDYPIDDAVLKPTRVFFLQSVGGFANTTHIVDLTSTVNTAGYDGKISPAFRDEVGKAAKGEGANKPTPAFTVQKKAWYSTDLHLRDANGDTLAELKSSLFKWGTSLLKWGTWDIVFPAQSPHSDHTLEMRPVSVGRREETFVKDSIPYFWDMEGGKHGTLYKAVGGKRVQIAEYAARHGFDKDCVLVLDAEQLDEVVALASCVALLNRSDSFQ